MLQKLDKQFSKVISSGNSINFNKNDNLKNNNLSTMINCKNIWGLYRPQIFLHSNFIASISGC